MIKQMLRNKKELTIFVFCLAKCGKVSNVNKIDRHQFLSGRVNLILTMA